MTQAAKPYRVGLLGLGNSLLSDEGFGPYCVRLLEERYQFPETVCLLDGGTAALQLIPFLEQCEALIVIDTVALADSPGAVHAFDDAGLRGADVQTRMSPHQVGTLEMLDICRVMGCAPSPVDFITVVPASLDPGLSLSPAVLASMDKVEGWILRRLQTLGVEVARRTAAEEKG